MTVAVGVDVGGTKILSGLVDEHGTVTRTDRRPTPADGDELVAAIVDAVTILCAEGDCSQIPIGCGFPALVTKNGVAKYGPNIGLADYPLRDQLVRRLDNPRVVIDNDANAATWAEFVAGAGRVVPDTMVMFTLGTGVGGGLIIDGSLHRGSHGFAGELGHIVLEVGGESGHSGVDGELEAYSSGSAMDRMARQAHRAGRFAGTTLDGPDAPDGERVTAAARQGEQPAVDILTAMGRYLGIGAAVFVNALDPELIVVGGGVAAAGELILEPARRALRRHVLGPDYRPEVPVVVAEFGSDAGMVGAGLLALRS
ncbi:ROK family glucokinase [soil metagenome]